MALGWTVEILVLLEIAMQYRAPLALVSAVFIAGCTTGSPNDVAVISGHTIGQAEVKSVVEEWSKDPLYEELSGVVGAQTLRDQAEAAAQQVAANRHLTKVLAYKLAVTLPDDAAVQAEFDRQLAEIGGVDKAKEQVVTMAKQSGMLQGPVSTAQLREQVRAQMNFAALGQALPVEDKDVDTFIAQAGLPAEQINDQIRQQAREAVRQERFQKEVDGLGIKVNPRLNLAEGVSILGQTTQSPNAAGNGAGQPGIPGQPGVPGQPQPGQ